MIVLGVVLILVLLSTVARAADVLETSFTLFGPYGSVYERMQGQPRDHIVPLATAGEVAVALAFFSGSSYEEIFTLSNYGSAWAGSLYVSANFHNHLHTTERGDTLYVMSNNYTGSLNLNRLFRIDLTTLTSPSIIDSVDIDSTGVSDDELSSIAFDGSGNDMMLILRGPEALNTCYWTSANKGVSWTNANADVNAYNTDVRIDIDEMGGDSISCMIYDRNSSPRAYDWYLWNGASWSAGTEVTSGAEFERMYSTCVGKDNVVHLSFSDTSNPSHVIHAWRNPAGGAWTIDTPYVASQRVTGTGGLWMAVSYSEYAQIARLYYTTNSGNNPNALYCKRWNYTTDDWETDSVRVSDASSTVVRNISGCLDVNASHLDRSYVGFLEQVGGNWATVLGVIADTSVNIRTKLKGVKP